MYVRRCFALVAALVAATAVAPGTANAAGEWDTSPVRAKWQALGGANFAGEKVGDEVVLDNGIRWAKFSKYDIVITWREAAGAHWTSGAISRLWLGTSPATSVATMDQVPVNRGAQAGAATAYDTGYSVYYSDAYGAHAIGGAARDKYWANGSVTGRFGWPASGPVDVNGYGTEQRFSEAVSFFHRQGEPKPFWISGALRDKYRATGAPTGPGAWLDSDQVEQPGNGWKVEFAGQQAIYWSAATGAHVLSWEMTPAYEATGGTSGPFGYPKTDTTEHSNDSYITEFVNNTTLYRSWHRDGVFWMSGRIRAKYDEIQRGVPVGYPRSSQTPAPGTDGEYVLFGDNRDQVIIGGPRTGAHLIEGEALRKLRAGGDVAVYGLPQHVHGIRYGEDGFVQFEKASIFVSSGAGLTIGWDVRNAWWHSGGTSSRLGMAREDQRTTGPGVVEQGFQHGLVLCDYNVSECYYGPQMTPEQVRRDGTKVSIPRR